MRKWIAIGVVVLALVGVGVYVLSRPRKGTVEYHKEQCVKEYEIGALGRIIQKGPGFLRNAYFKRRGQRLDFHRRALLDLGYLQSKVFVLSNRIPDYETGPFPEQVASHPAFDQGRLVIGNSVFVIVPIDDLAAWEDAVRQFDVPRANE